MLADRIHLSQEGNKEATMALVEKFDRLFNKYARLLQYEDAKSDLTVDFLTLIKGLKLEKMNSTCDGALVNYIVRAVKYSYMKHSKRRSEAVYRETGFSELTEEQLCVVEGKNAVDGTDEITAFFENIPSGLLSEKEQRILTMEYCLGMSSAEIANQDRVSRQSINQAKQRALKRLKTAMNEEGQHDGEALGAKGGNQRNGL